MNTIPQISSYLLLLTLNINGSNFQSNDVAWLKGYKNKTQQQSTRNSFHKQKYTYTESDGMGKYIPGKWK